MNRPRMLVALGATAVAAALALAPTAASAMQPSTIEFTNRAPLSVPFGSDWYTQISVAFTTTDFLLPAPPAQGTVTVYVEGISEPWATALPIAADGSVYVSQPLEQPLLAAGTYALSAIFVPSPGAFMQTSQTTAPLELIVTPLTVAGQLQMVTNEASASPIIQANLSGTYLETNGGAPAGTWAFTVTDDKGVSVFDAELPVAQGEKDPLGVELAAKLKPGATYTVAGAFTPVPELAGGVTLADVKNVEYAVGGAPGSGTITLPLWAAIALAIVVVGLAAAAIVLALRSRPAAVAAAPTTIEETP